MSEYTIVLSRDAGTNDNVIRAPLAEVGTVVCLPNKQSPNFLQLHVRMHHTAQSPSPGAWLTILTSAPDGTGHIVLGRVVNTWEHNPHEDPQGATVAQASSPGFSPLPPSQGRCEDALRPA